MKWNMRLETKIGLLAVGVLIVMVVPVTLIVAAMLGVYQPVIDLIDQYLWLLPVIMLVYYCWLLWY